MRILERGEELSSDQKDKLNEDFNKILGEDAQKFQAEMENLQAEMEKAENDIFNNIDLF